MLNNSFIALAHWDNPKGNRYTLDLKIISVEMDIKENRQISHQLKY